MPAELEDIENKVSSLADEGSTVPVDRSIMSIDSAPSAGETNAGEAANIDEAETGTKSDVTINDSVPLSLAKFDVLQFKNSFLEVVEEVRMRRVIDAENEERIKQLVTENHDLHQKLEEECSRSSSLIEGHSHQETQLRKEYEEKLKQIELQKAKNDLSLECWEQELKALKEEIRSLHLVRYTLEKKVQEQERQLHVQTSSRDSYHSKIKQLEEECGAASTKVEGIPEQMERLEANVKGVQELHKKLEYVNEHQKCELEQCRKQLEVCRGELTETRVELAGLQGNEDHQSTTEEHAAKLRATEQELRLQVEINKQVQSQLLRVREEHRTVLVQLKEAHMLIERHVESNARLGASEMLIQEELTSMRAQFEESEKKLLSSTTAYQSLKERFDKITEELKTKYEDVNSRLKALQSDHDELQSFHNALITTNSTTERELKTKIEEMNADREKSLKLAQESAEQRKLSQEEKWREKVEQFQSALEQSEVLLAEKESSLQEKTRECSKLQLQLRQCLNATVIDSNPSDPPLLCDSERLTGDLEKPDSESNDVEDETKGAGLNDKVSLQEIPELIISPDILPSSPPRRHYQQRQIPSQNEVAMYISKMAESTKVSPKLCLQRLPLAMQMRSLPLIDKKADSLESQNNEGSLASATTLSGSRDLEMSGSPPKKPRMECPDDQLQDSVQCDDNIQENETNKQLGMNTTEPSEQLVGSIQGEQSSEIPLGDANTTSQMEEVLSLPDKPDSVGVKRESGISSQRPAGGDDGMDQQQSAAEPCISPLLSSDDELSFELREEDEMMNTQISKQINKVQVFLKMDRLRKRKKH